MKYNSFAGFAVMKVADGLCRNRGSLEQVAKYLQDIPEINGTKAKLAMELANMSLAQKRAQDTFVEILDGLEQR